MNPTTTMIRRLIPALVLSIACAAASAAAPPSLVNYQGVLRDASGDPENGDFDMVFRFFNADIGGDELLVDTHDGAAAVTVSAGLFNVQLGGGLVSDGSGPGLFLSLAEVFPAEGEIWLELQIDGETLSPRVRIVSSAYALNAAALDGADAGQFLRSDTDDTYSSGTLTTAPGTILDVDGSVYLDGQLFMDQDGPDGVQSIFFYNSGEPAGESIDWDNFNERFYFSDNLNISTGTLFLNDDKSLSWDDPNNRFSFSNDVSVSSGFLFLDPFESLSWDDLDARFEMTGQLALSSALRVGSITSTPVSYNTIGGGTPDSGDISSVSDLYVSADLEVDSQLYLNGEIRMDDGEGDQNIFFFDNASATDEALSWDDSDDRFELSNHLAVAQGIRVGSVTSGSVNYSAFGFESSALVGISTSSDVFISEDLEVDGTTYPGILSAGPNAGHLMVADLGIPVVIDDDNDSTVEQASWYHHTPGVSGKLMELQEDGDLRIGGTLSENVNFDLAESFWKAGPAQPGDLVAVVPGRPDAVRLTSGAGDRLLLGVVSEKPGVLLGGAPFGADALEQVWGAEIRSQFDAQADDLAEELLAESPELERNGAEDHETGRMESLAVERFFERHFAAVALSGRVPVKVDTAFGEIAVGDLLAPSPIPGVAMKATEPGPIVGTALEAFSGGRGSVLTFVHRGGFPSETTATEDLPDDDPQPSIAAPVPNPVTGVQTLAGNLQIVLDAGADDQSRLSVLKNGDESLANEVFRVDEDGNVWAQGSFRPASMDLAEYYPVTEPVGVGDVLVVDRDAPGRLRKATESADPAVVGIVSDEPGVLLGTGLSRIRGADPQLAAAMDQARWTGDRQEEARLWAELEHKFNQAHAPIALSGTVVCKVDAGFGAIEIGDLLTSSPTPGHAMRADEARAGTIVGKAIEGLDAGTGTIRVLVMLR